MSLWSWIDRSTDQCVCACGLWQMALTVRSRQRGRELTALLHEPGPHVGARGDSPLHDLHLFLEPKVISGWSQMFGLSLFRALPDRFEYITRPANVTTNVEKNKKVRNLGVWICSCTCSDHTRFYNNFNSWWHLFPPTPACTSWNIAPCVGDGNTVVDYMFPYIQGTHQVHISEKKKN